MKILISGIGGVGGYFGGHIANQALPNNEIYFFAKQKTANAINQQGLVLQASNHDVKVHPNKTSSNPKDFGVVDLIVFCTKSYDLENNLQQLYPCINDQTILLPLLNGINNEQIIQQHYPNNTVWNGYCFVFAWKENTNTVKEVGGNAQLYFGKGKQATPQMLALNDQIKAANIKGGHTTEIIENQWKKFFFISTLATFTSYYDITVGNIINHQQYLTEYKQLLAEFITFANHQLQENNIEFRFKESDKENIIALLNQSKPKATTSMQRDFSQGKKTELESLTGIIAKSNLHLPLYNKMYQALHQKQQA